MNKILDTKIESDLIEFTFKNDYVANIFTTRLYSMIKLNYGMNTEVFSKQNKLCVSGYNSSDVVEFVENEIQRTRCVF